MGFLAGVYYAAAAHLSVTVSQGLDYNVTNANNQIIRTVKASPSAKAFFTGAIYPLGLMIVSIAGGEISTPNMGIMVPALIHHDSNFYEYFISVIIAYFANLVGAIFWAYFAVFQTDFFLYEPFNSAIKEIGTKKLERGFGALFLNGIAANWLHNLAFVLAIESKHTFDRILAV